MKDILKKLIGKLKKYDEIAEKKKKDSPIDILFYIVPVVLLVGAIALVAISSFSQKTNPTPVSDELYNAYSNDNTFKNRVYGEDQTPNMENTATPSIEDAAISVYGDSFCISADPRIPSFPAFLSKYTNLTLVYNVATPKDSIETMAAREGGVPMYISPCDIPQKKEKVEITLENGYGTSIVPDFDKNAGLNPCIVDGVEGVISMDNDGTLYFTRSKSGYEKIIATPTIVTTRAMDYRLNDVTIFFVGSDSLYSDTDKTVEIYKRMVNNLQTDKYLIIGPVFGTAEEIESGNDALSEEFDDNFLNIYDYLCNDAVEENEIDLSKDDIEKIENHSGLPEYCLIKDTEYFSEQANDLVGKKIAETLKSLKYIS